MGCQSLLQGSSLTPDWHTSPASQRILYRGAPGEARILLLVLTESASANPDSRSILPEPRPLGSHTSVSSRSGSASVLQMSLLISFLSRPNTVPPCDGVPWLPLVWVMDTCCFPPSGHRRSRLWSTQAQAHTCLYTRYLWGASPRSGALGPEATLQLSY